MLLKLSQNPGELLGYQAEQLGEASREGGGLPAPAVVGHVQRVPALLDAAEPKAGYLLVLLLRVEDQVPPPAEYAQVGQSPRRETQVRQLLEIRRS